MKIVSILRENGWKITTIVMMTIVAFMVGRRPISGSEIDFELNGTMSPDLPSADSFFRYTPPSPLQRLANEWEPQRALVLSMSFNESRNNLDVARYQIELMAAAHQYLDIYVFCDPKSHQDYAYFLALLNRHPAADAIMERTHFIDSGNLMRWTRDFGPIFGIGQKKQLVAIDFVYRNLIWELEGTLQKKEDPNRNYLAMRGDAMPADVVSYLQQQNDSSVEIVRPPISMDGGDFVSDGQGNVFVSTRTLARNGGNRTELEALFKRYFGAKKLHILEALPGGTVHHLDMIFKFVNEDTVLLPDYQTSPEPPLNRYRTQLSKDVRHALDQNERYIRKHLPHLRVLKVPMPPILFKTPIEILREAKEEFVRITAAEREIVSAADYDQLSPPEKARVTAQITSIVQAETGLSDLESFAGFDAILRQYGQMSLRDYLDIHAESVTRYRSYINSVFLHSEIGEQAFILPRFTSPYPTENNRLRLWESEVEAIYLSVWPEAKLHWVNCDTLVADMGFIHCSTITIPAAPLD